MIRPRQIDDDALDGELVVAGHRAFADGAWADNPRIKIGCYPVRVEGDTVQVQAPDPPPKPPRRRPTDDDDGEGGDNDGGDD